MIIRFTRDGRELAIDWPTVVDPVSMRLLVGELGNWPDWAVDARPVPTVLLSSEDYAIPEAATKLLDQLYDYNNRDFYYFTKRLCDDERTAQTCPAFSCYIDSRCSRLLELWDANIQWMDKWAKVYSYGAKRIIYTYYNNVLVHGDCPGILDSLYQVALAGMCPVGWMGKWPNGFCYAYCPPGHLWEHGLPASWQASPQCVREAKRKPKAVPPIVLPVPQVTPAAWTELQTLSEQHPAGHALSLWWSSWAESDACREVLKAICARVDRLEVRPKMLRIHARDPFDDKPIMLEALLPFAGELKPMPLSAARLVRVHAGLDFVREQNDRVVIVPKYNGSRFSGDYGLWWTQDPWNAEEPFRKPMLVPCTDGDDIWVYHQLRERSPGELELRRINHERGDLRRALPFGAGGAVLRVLAGFLVPRSDDHEYDFGLRDDFEEPQLP